MPTIKESLYFNYDGISSKDFGLMSVGLGGGMFEEQLVASREIIETQIRGSDTPLFHGLEEEPMSFSLVLAFESKYTDKDVEDIILWLFQDHYKPLYFEDKPDRVFQCMPIGESMIVHNGLKEGYVTVEMRCKSSKLESTLQQTETYNVVGNMDISISNNGHVDIYPEISLKKIGSGHITFTSSGGEIFEIRNLTDQEDIYINCEKEIIETDAIGIYRYEDVVGDFEDMILKLGSNTFNVVGDCEVSFRYKFKYRF